MERRTNIYTDRQTCPEGESDLERPRYRDERDRQMH